MSRMPNFVTGSALAAALYSFTRCKSMQLVRMWVRRN
jgi:hypothetical protein